MMERTFEPRAPARLVLLQAPLRGAQPSAFGAIENSETPSIVAALINAESARFEDG
jgi:hypothetical protein